jgi:hypothetical protein
MLQGFVSCRRIEKYMRAAEVSAVDNPLEGVDISLNSATITWPRDRAPEGLEGQGSGQVTAAPSAPATPKAEFTLSDLNLNFPHGELSLICGRLGVLITSHSEADGQVPERHSCFSVYLAKPMFSPVRSSALGRLRTPWTISIKRLQLKTGSSRTCVVSRASFTSPDISAYVPQQAWLQNATIKDNIVFSSPWDEERYERVLDACSLRSDLAILEDGDQTYVSLLADDADAVVKLVRRVSI